MANKRSLKRGINYICGELFAECIAVSLYNVNCDKGNVDTLLTYIIHIHSDFVARVSHPEPGMKPREYYKVLVGKFNNEVNNIVDMIGNLH